MIGYHCPRKHIGQDLTQSAVSSHTILENNSPVESVSLQISRSNSIEDTIAMVTLDRLDSGGRFVQNYGAGIIRIGHRKLYLGWAKCNLVSYRNVDVG